jgi:hypothetical protein
VFVIAVAAPFDDVAVDLLAEHAAAVESDDAEGAYGDVFLIAGNCRLHVQSLLIPVSGGRREQVG